uniref:Glutaredoxin and cysteine rich domain containing 2 n=1 Tax=Gasterosteus aculeatus aculeatus TaxID=481459 RepID=G3QBY0_GASAC
MERMTVTQQPRLSVTRGSVSTFEKEEVRVSITGSEDALRSNNVPAAADPILTQPGLGITTTTITTITQTGGDWSTGLLNVCGDKTTCALGALAPCCLDLSLAHQYGECLCTPLLPGSTFAMRVGIRERYKIRCVRVNKERREKRRRSRGASCSAGAVVPLPTTMEELQRKLNQRYEGTKPRKVSYL